MGSLYASRGPAQPPRRALPVPLEARVAQTSPVVQGQRPAAAVAEADIVAQAVEQDLVDLVGGLFPAVVELVLVHGAVEGLGEGEVEVQLPAVLLQLRQGGVPLRQAGLLDGLPQLPAAEELEEQVPQGVLCLVKGNVGAAQLLLLGEQEALLPDLGDRAPP